jgi:polysaccharide pyruvyl transferase WcaK-like protein
LHSAIFALCQGTPVVVVPYLRGGKWHTLDMLGVRDIDIAADSVTAGALDSKAQAVWDRRMEMAATVRGRLPELALAVEDNLKIPLAMLRARAAATPTRPNVGIESPQA